MAEGGGAGGHGRHEPPTGDAATPMAPPLWSGPLVGGRVNP